METKVDSRNCGILKSVDPESSAGEVIGKRISSPYYITDELTVEDVAGIFTGNSTIQALGVTGNDLRARGIILRNEVFALIGQKFGRELYMNKSIKDIVQPAEHIYYRRNTFSVINEFSEHLRSADNRFYILTDSENMYRGLVSSFDLVLFLSDMMTRELMAARRIHSAIVKDDVIIESGRMSVEGTMIMAGETGGDFHHVRSIGDNRWFISLCDVSGKGLNAGLISVAVSSMYAVYDFRNGIDELIRRINSYIYGLFEGEIFLTGVFIEFDESTGELDLYDMGHSMIYIFRDGGIIALAGHDDNLPLGIKNESTPVKSRIRLESGDLLVSYSDGLPEQGSITNEKFGEKNILSLVNRYRNSSLKQVRDIVFDELRSWRLGNTQADDMSLVMLRYR
ncbi:MAG TPA: SpoIIE family protein phosphatase [Spirochaetota bacterium]|nr:SpoIIE family protein phosphatase [Spirochaetota bacterium]HQO39433.1 SpoIIE family protein phosphatase [Spirochaetota bacterium]